MTPDNSTFTVLLMDDDALILDSLTELLDTNGFQIHTATSSAECIAKISNGIQPDLLITDFMMNKINGIEVVKRIRKFLDKEIPAIIFTDDTSVETREAIRKSGCIFLSKPTETSLLINHICAMSA